MIWDETAGWGSQKLGEVGWSGKEGGFNMKRTEGSVARRQSYIVTVNWFKRSVQDRVSMQVNQCRITWSFCEKKTTMALT